MNFEKEAREILDVVSEDYSPTYIALMEEALRKAYLSGQEDAGWAVQNLRSKYVWTDNDLVVDGTLERALEAIRSLPLQSNDEKELG